MGAASIEVPSQPVAAIWIPLRMELVADGVNRQNDGNAGPERGRIGGSMNQLNAGSRGGSRQPDQRPAGIAWRMRGGGDPCDPRRDGGHVTTEGDDLQRLTQPDKRGHQFGCITADS